MAFQNFFAAKLYADIGASDTTITLDTAPTATSGRMTLEARNPTQREIIKYTGVAGNQLTGVTRGVGGTSAKSHLKNALVEMNLTSEDIQDLYDAFNTFSAYASNGWVTAASTISNMVYNGNRSYTFNTSSDMTTIVSPGMRGRTTRGTPAPIQSANLNGTTQYFSKTTPAGMTFTDDFVVSAWVKMTSYNGTFQMIASRYNGTSGWYLGTNANGQVVCTGYNGGSGNLSQVTSYQSIPLNKWVHVATQLDMSAFTATTTTSYVMIDGVDVPAFVTRSGTNPTALIQAGNLEIGSYNGGLLPFPGKIAQAAVFSAKVTQATIRGYISQGLLGTETNLISAYSFNGTATDLNTTNANNLTANGGAVATNADAPWGYQAGGTISSTLDYFIVQAVTSTTMTVQVPEGCTIPTTGAISAWSYSVMKAPFGFPTQKSKWQLMVYWRASISMVAASGVWTSGVTSGMTAFNIPTGEWSTTYSLETYGDNGASSTAVRFATLSTSPTAETDRYWSTNFETNQATGTTFLAVTMTKTGQLSLAAATPYYALVQSTGAIGNQQLNVSNTTSYIIADNAYL